MPKNQSVTTASWGDFPGCCGLGVIKHFCIFDQNEAVYIREIDFKVSASSKRAAVNKLLKDILRTLREQHKAPDNWDNEFCRSIVYLTISNEETPPEFIDAISKHPLITFDKEFINVNTGHTVKIYYIVVENIPEDY